MMTTLGRYILRSLLVNYVIALVVMISLYVVLDMFVNMDEFTEQGYPVGTVLKNIASYYWPSIFLYFRELSGVITLFACLSAVARMRRLNELTAVLASGISLYRLAAPVVAFGLATTVLLIIDTEVIIPRVAHLLARDHDDADGTRAYEILFLPDRDGALLSAGQFHPHSRDLRDVVIIKRDADGTVRETIEADRAVWEEPGAGRPHGRWRLDRGVKTTRVSGANSPIAPIQGRNRQLCQFYESDLSPEAIQVRQAEGWVRFLSLSQLRDLQDRGAPNLASIIQTRHARVTAPIVAIVLLLLGLPFFLDRSPANVLSDTAKCMILCGLCYVSAFVAQSIRSSTASALPAWSPIFVFATIAMIKLDRIRT